MRKELVSWPPVNNPTIEFELMPDEAPKPEEPKGFAEVIRSWLLQKRREGCSYETIQIYGNRLGRLLAFCKDGKVTPSKVIAHIDDLKASGFSNDFIVSQCTTIKSALSWAYKTGLIQYDIAPRLQIKLPPTKRRTSTVTYDQYTRIRDACTDPKYRLMIEVLYWTPLRVCDVVELKWSDIDFDQCLIKIKPKKTRRHGNDCVIPIIPGGPLHAGLSVAYKSRCSEYVFPWKNGRISVTGPKQVLRKIMRSIGVTESTIHSFRRTYISRAINSGIPTEVVMKIAGISAYRTMKHYVVIKDSSILEAGLKMQEIMEKNTGRL